MSASTDLDLAAWYRRYNARCNAHEFDRLGEFVCDDVEVNGSRQGLSAYVSGLQNVVRAFPDYRWDIRHLFVDSPWISAHFLDTGTQHEEFLGIASSGRAVRLQEFAVYRVENDRIAEVWVTADNLSLLEQLR